MSERELAMGIKCLYKCVAYCREAMAQSDFGRKMEVVIRARKWETVVMSLGAKIPYIVTPSKPGIAPLEPGDQLTRDEFERRFDATPGLKKAELIEGVVYMHPAVRAKAHGGPHADIVACLVYYRSMTPGVEVYDNSSIRLDLDNEPQPDAAMLIAPEFGGQVKISDDDYIEGAPELVVEVSSSSVSIDLNAKLRVYRRNGVREYLVWRVLDRVLDQFVLREGRFDAIPASADGILRSTLFPGMWLDTAALIRGDIAAVFGLLQQGTQSPEHAAFADDLRSRGSNFPK
ncbi:MAG TPA: Uma2 family endonuclease [Humisphaera sp.]|nr:Uma2 family endonuclease [Humisphaera sp.]